VNTNEENSIPNSSHKEHKDTKKNTEFTKFALIFVPSCLCEMNSSFFLCALCDLCAFVRNFRIKVLSQMPMIEIGSSYDC